MAPPLKPYPTWVRLLAPLSALALFGAAALVGQVIPLPRRVDRGMVSALLMTGALLVGTFGVLVFAVLVTRRNGAIVDAAFAAVGLRGERSFVRGRQYHGLFAGRRVDAYFVPPARYRGASLEIYLGSSLRTRLSVGLRSMSGAVLRQLVGHSEITTRDPSYSHLYVRAADEGWARGVLRHPAAKGAILRLFGGASDLRFVLIEPEAVLLRIAGVSLHTLSPELVRSWADDLASLAHAAESLPPPARAHEPGAFERAARTGRAGLTAIVVVIVVAMVLILGAVAMVAMLQLGGRR